MQVKWYDLAVKELWTQEFAGAMNNPTIVRYYADATGQRQPDSVPWCAAFVGAMLERAGYRGSRSLAARSYLRWGQKLVTPRLGCIVVLQRGESWQGHVGFFVRKDANNLLLLGGNQRNRVSYEPYGLNRLLGYRWPK